MEIISLNIIKGGCAKTTTVQAFAEILGGKFKKRVLVIDTDLQCSLTIVSGIDPMEHQDHNLYTLLHGESTIDQCIIKGKYYDIIPASTFLSYVESEFSDHSKGHFLILKNKLEGLKESYDYVFIDTPPALGIMNIMSLTASDKVIIPTECSYLAIKGLEHLAKTIEGVKKHANKNLEITGIFLVKYKKRHNLDQGILYNLQDISSRMHTKVFDKKIRETTKIGEAQCMMSPLIEYEPKCTAFQDYIALTKEIFAV